MLTIDETVKIYEQMRRTKWKDLLEDLVEKAIQYARIRVDWLMKNAPERREMDAMRTAAHNAVIEACNILSRKMIAAGEDNAWRAKIGTDRKEIGDFACCLHCIFGIMAR